MKALLITAEYPPFKGGVASYYDNLVKHFPKEDSVLVLDDSDKELNFNNKLRFSWIKSIFSIIKKTKKESFDILLTGQILPYGTSLYIVSLLKKMPYGVFLHGLDFSLAIVNKKKKFLTNIILKKSKIIVCANSYLAGLVKEKYPDLIDRVVVVNPGTPNITININKLSFKRIEEKYYLKNKKIIFSLGRLVERKGFDMTIKAIGEMKSNEKKDLVYFIAGTGKEESYLKSLVKNEDKKRIIFLGEISDEEKWIYLNNCDIFIMPSRNIDGDYEGFGIVYLEANWCSKPVIAGLAGGVADAVADNLNGILVKPESVESIKEAILKLKNDPELAKKLGQAGRERALNEFSWDKLARNFVKYIKLKI